MLKVRIKKALVSKRVKSTNTKRHLWQKGLKVRIKKGIGGKQGFKARITKTLVAE